MKLAPVTVRIARYVRKPLEGGGFTRVQDGEIVGEIVLDIDASALAWALGSKALGNKSHKASLAHGKIIARASNVRSTGSK